MARQLRQVVAQFPSTFREPDDNIIRGELFSVERLEQFAAVIAQEHQEVGLPKRFHKLLPRLDESQRVLVTAYRSLADAIRDEQPISPAAEWLVDNFHIVEEQLREVREDLPRGFLLELPKLKHGDLKGYPRIYAVAIALISHSDSRLDIDAMERFLRAYQRVTPLNIGELWAVAITLRLILVENLRRLAIRIVISRNEREAADALADELLELAGRHPDRLTALLTERFGKRKRMGHAFVAQITRRLREQDPAIAPCFEWLEKQLQKQGESTDQIVQLEHQRQAATQVTVGNIITSMRLLSTLDWRRFFESVSLIDPLLSADPVGVYARMDFATRDRYRHVIERISKRSHAEELEVGRYALELAQQAHQAEAEDERRAHVGFYLMDDGLVRLEEHFDYQTPISVRVRRACQHHPNLVYLGMVATLTALITGFLVFVASNYGAPPFLLIAFALLSLIPASDLAVTVLNWDFTHLLAPRVLPRMETSTGIDDDARTFVVIPTLFTSKAVVEELLEKLEVHQLANSEKNLFFALLGDFSDAPEEEMPEDTLLLEQAIAGIRDLNERYPNRHAPRFHLFHRRRQWNSREGIWMGWERKRGKLQEFNRLLRGATDTSFIVSTADEQFLAAIRFVITLDSDTQVPRDAARELVGVASHPLNRPHFDPELRRVTRGYGILQPRISISLTSAGRSRFSRIMSGTTGIDPYTTATSDVYQDLFAEGSFTGKGLYDVDAFEAALEGRVPENSILSHDLFEGFYARCALVTDIELLDDYPAHYDSYAMRTHRWVRGDWQIARWLFPYVHDAKGRTVRNTLPLISRWKILDNLRRSLVAPSVLVWLLAVWTVIPGSPLQWTLFILTVLAFPVYANVASDLLNHRRRVPWISQLRSAWADLLSNTAQVSIAISCIAHQAYLKTDAIVRTLYRKLISRRHLLEWVAAAQAETASPHDLPAFIRLMWPATAIALVSLGLVLWLRPEAVPVAAVFILAWGLSPFIAYRISQFVKTGPPPLTPKDRTDARLVARRTWRFFETFVGDDDHWLPPDNYQEDPQPAIAHRTSPTNIGMLLLSTVAAHDLGYLGALEMTERLELTFGTLQKLERFRGQFLNWYDTVTLEPLSPHYVSTVDSGNLAGHLIALKQAMIETPDRPLFDSRVFAGLTDTVQLMREEAAQLRAFRQRTAAVTVKELNIEVERCGELIASGPKGTASEWSAFLESLARHADVIIDISDALSQEHGHAHFTELRFWAVALAHQTRALRRDRDTLFPWAAALVTHLSPVLNRCGPAIEAQWQQLAAVLTRLPSLAQLPDMCHSALTLLENLARELERCEPQKTPDRDAALNGLKMLTHFVEAAVREANRLMTRLGALAHLCDSLSEQMDFRFLLDKEREVFVIGYLVTENKPDNSFYDLLASEARLGSFVAIAKGDAPQEHWFRMGRPLTPADGSRALISWTATMFEYLMPLLVMRDYEGTLLNQSYGAIVRRQIEYGAERGVPWGVSESAYNARDLQLNYQYGPFGVPGLGLKRGLSEDLVVAPYASALAALVMPHAALENMRRLTREGVLARYGFYESIDYTPERLPPNQKRVIIRAFMTHHQGMSLVALNNVLNGNIMQRRFHSEPLVRATELLLQERVARNVVSSYPRVEEVLSSRVVPILTGRITRTFDTANLPTPRTQILSNGTYSVVLTTAGSGYSMCAPLAVTRWREDPTRDNWGTFIYLRDIRSGVVWSAGYQPTGRLPRSYEVIFAEDKVEIRRQDVGINTRCEVIVSPEDNSEVRRITLTNLSSNPREIEVTSYAEVVLASPAADAAHPAFSNLFIETEFFAGENSLIAKRRPRAEDDEPVWVVHTVVTEGETLGAVQYETDRARFLGRGHDVSNPVAVMEDRPLSNTVGPVLDPVLSLRQRVRIQPEQTLRISFSTAVVHSYEEALQIADKYHSEGTFGREASLAWTRSQVELRHLNLTADDAHLFQLLAGRIIYSDSSLRPRPHVLALNTLTQASLWPYGISGDLPIVLVRINRAEELPSVRQLLRAHKYLRLKGLTFDLVILNDHPPSYIQSLQAELLMLIRTFGEPGLMDKSGGVFLRRSDQIPEADRILLHAVARAVFVIERGTFEEQILREPADLSLPEDFVPRQSARIFSEPMMPPPELSFYNGLGGFSQGGREYVAVLGEGQWTPAPWLNVVANAQGFGFQVSETGGGYTWSVNSRENRLTPWSNDAVADPPGEVIYLRDEESGVVWTPTPLPIREIEPYTVRHGQGYTVFEHSSHGIAHELLMFVPTQAPVKISLLRLRNRTDRVRNLSVTSYNELVLGVNPATAAPYLITEMDEESGGIFARNPYNNDFANHVAFLAMSERETTWTCDRKEFLGRNGSVAGPRALRREKLSNRAGAGFDPCAAMQAHIKLEPGEVKEISILLGQGESAEEARALVSRYRQASEINNALEQVLRYWEELLGTLEVQTPDPALDTLVNRWLLYQSLSCRVWGRTAFYQSGGAYGFRDQLQDVMALVYAKPNIAREQILRAASRQFKEGDVQHWWHPPTGRGVRTRFSDDLLWLPFVLGFYIRVTGDHSILDERVAFIEAPLLEAGQDESYLMPTVSAETGTIYEHCVRALERSLATGVHGLPLMGSGDWNDGMNRVGHEGKGESVWLGWFLYASLAGFLPYCEARREKERGNRYQEHMEKLKVALEANAWDGDWYRRAYFDDGSPLGSAQNDECRIDSIAQSWAVISQAGDPPRAARAMAAVEEYLVRRGDGLVLLFTPPFDKSSLHPGYIKGYVPGVRENGGQYTHAAIWTVIAHAMLGDGDRAGELFALLNPINHASTRAGFHKYKVEPYVAAGDVYAVWPHTGRGGWTWYTGSASWMYRAAVENILGFRLSGRTLRVQPCVPRWWREFEINYRRGGTHYQIKVENPLGVSCGVAEILLDGEPVGGLEIPLSDEPGTHQVRITLGERATVDQDLDKSPVFDEATKSS